jgi:hypothetical protein
MPDTPLSVEEPTASKRLLWVKVLLWILGVLVVLVLCFYLWYRSSGDLVAAWALAKSKGLPTTWAEKGLVLSPSERIAKWDRIAQLVKEVPKYNKTAFSLKPFEPPPADLQRYHASLDQTKLAELLALVDGIGDEPLILWAKRDLNTLRPEISNFRDLQLFFQERIVSADPDEVAIMCRRQLHLVRIFSTHCLWDQFHRARLLSIGLDSVVVRMTDLGADGKEIADQLDSLADELVAGVAEDWSGEVAFAFSTVETMGQYWRDYFRRTYWNSLFSLGIDNPLLIRAGRYRYLSFLVGQAAQLASVRTGPALVAQLHACLNQLKELHHYLPNHRLTILMQSYYNIVYFWDYTCRIALSAHLLAAEIRNEPWPVDWFDPTGKPLRPVEREGKIIGAYSLGLDGVDHGVPVPGKSILKLYFALHGPLKPPTPPEKPMP